MQPFYVLFSALLPFALATDAVHIINVGKNGLTFEPNTLQVPNGATVEFHFWPGTHSVAQSSFWPPCAPKNISDGIAFTTTGFFSGPIDVAAGESPKVFAITANASDDQYGPAGIWFYCATSKHCQSGMVGVINPPAPELGGDEKNIANYIAMAANVSDTLTPTSVGGGTFGTPATAAPSNPASTQLGNPNSGVEARGGVQWGLLSLSMLMTGMICNVSI